MRKDYDTKSLIYTVLILMVFLCVLSLWIVFGDASKSDMPVWLRWILG